jgi:hypothetical protein
VIRFKTGQAEFQGLGRSGAVLTVQLKAAPYIPRRSFFAAEATA